MKSSYPIIWSARELTGSIFTLTDCPARARDLRASAYVGVFYVPVGQIRIPLESIQSSISYQGLTAIRAADLTSDFCF